jgi:aminopeptidase N
MLQDNFYTVTVYEKGAEVVRLYSTLLGKAGFRKGGWSSVCGGSRPATART